MDNYEMRRRTVEGMVNKIIKECVPSIGTQTHDKLLIQMVCAFFNYGDEQFNNGRKECEELRTELERVKGELGQNEYVIDLQKKENEYLAEELEEVKGELVFQKKKAENLTRELRTFRSLVDKTTEEMLAEVDRRINDEAKRIVEAKNNES